MLQRTGQDDMHDWEREVSARPADEIELEDPFEGATPAEPRP